MHGIKRQHLSKDYLEQKRQRDESKIKFYKDLTDKLLSNKLECVYTPETFLITTTILNLNPELNVAWNYRRRIIINYFLSDECKTDFDWNKELMFTMEQMKKFPKVYWIWGYRTWCLRTVNKVEMWEQELKIVSKMLEMDSRNYHGWAYRRYVVSQIESMSGKKMFQQEFEYTTHKINSNISNFSAWHQRASLFPQIFKSKTAITEDVSELIKFEISYITNGIFTDADDQSIWMYMKWFIKEDFIVEYLKKTKSYEKMLNEFIESIETINEDEIDFKGNENPWCLKLLIVIETILIEDLSLEIPCKRKTYLEKLCEIDSLRKNRYLRQLHDL